MCPGAKQDRGGNQKYPDITIQPVEETEPNDLECLFKLCVLAGPPRKQQLHMGRCMLIQRMHLQNNTASQGWFMLTLWYFLHLISLM